MWIKICGNTRVQDCLLAAELGANAVGFVFAPGKRTVTVEQVAQITPALPPLLERIGVFTTTDFDTITSAVRLAGLTGVQVHATVSFDLLRRLRTFLDATAGPADAGIRLMQVVSWWTDLDASEQVASFRAEVERLGEDGSVDAILIDSRTQTASGGTGKTFDWAAAAPVLARSRVPVIAAGGLAPGNVADAVRTLRPFGVDVSSGVEEAPGQKSPEKLRAFFRALQTS